MLDLLQMFRELYDQTPGNVFDDPALGPMFDPPLVAVASADDLWFARLKDVIGSFHWTPREALALVAPQAVARSVICWCLPVSRPAREGNRARTDRPDRLWAYVRRFGEPFNDSLRRAVAEHLAASGRAAVAPTIAPQNQIIRRPVVGHSSNWSERHVAFVAGMGTFGLSGGLITRAGVAHRLGSVVTDLELPPTPRAYGDEPFAWCLHLTRGTCGACISRCPAKSIGRAVSERDRDACYRYSYEMIARQSMELYGFDGTTGCGLCQTRVPCEYRKPTTSSGPDGAGPARHATS